MSFILWWRGEGNITKRPKKKPWRKGQSRSWTFSFHKYFTNFFCQLFTYFFNYFYFILFFPCFFYPDIYPHPHRTHPRPRTSIHFPRQLHRVSVTVEKKISDFKKRLIDRGSPQTLIENLLSCMKFTDRECAKHNNKEDKRNSVFRDTVPALSVYFKGRFNEKMESYTILLRQIF